MSYLRGRASEFDAAHLFLTIIQIHSARHLISQHTSISIGTNAVQHDVFCHAHGCFSGHDTGFPIRYRSDGNIFNLRRLQAKPKVQTDVLDELLYADDMDKNARSEAKMKRAMDQVLHSCDNYDLTISTKKTEVVHQPAPGNPYNEPTITVNEQKLKVVDKFTYLGSTLSRAVHIDEEVTARIAKARVAFVRLRANVWEQNGIKLDTQLKVFKAVVLPTLLYACETWTVCQRHAKRLEKAVKIKWQDTIPDTEVLKKAGMQSMHTILKLAQLRWTGHVIRTSKASLLWRTTRGKAPSKWPEETLQRHTRSLSEEFRHTNWVLGIDFSGAFKVARSHQQNVSSL